MNEKFTRDHLKSYLRNILNEGGPGPEGMEQNTPELDACRELLESMILELVTRQQKADRGQSAPFNLGNGIYDAKMSHDETCEKILQMAARKAMSAS